MKTLLREKDKKLDNKDTKKKLSQLLLRAQKWKSTKQKKVVNRLKLG